MEMTVYRKCSYCGLKALSKKDLNLFTKDKYKPNFNYTKNICKNCNARLNREKKQGPLFGPFYIRQCYILQG